MRAGVGLVLANAWLVLIGLSVLQALGLWSRARCAVVFVLGPGLLAGAAAVLPLLIVTLVAGAPLTLLTLVIVGACVLAISRACALAGARHGDHAGIGARSRIEPWLAAVAIVYALAGAIAIARAPTIGDDARIWSLRGLTLSYFHRLAPEIFLSRVLALGHPVYPLFQPVLEAIVSEAMGSPQLRIEHSELWLLAISAIWTAAALVADRDGARARSARYWLAPVLLVSLTPFVRRNVEIGDADVTGSVLLAVAIVGFALFIESGRAGQLGFGALLLAAAASTKDEEYLVSAFVLVAVLFAAQVGRPWRREPSGGAPWRVWLAAAGFVACVVAPWRVWVAAHHLSDPVQPSLPQALSPIWLIHRAGVGDVISAMGHQVLEQWGWSAAIFLVTCAVCLATRTAVRVTLFYLGSVLAIAGVLAWVYVATSQPLVFLIPTSMDRTVAAFMLPAGLASAHLLAALLSEARSSVPTTATAAWWRSSRTASHR